MDNRGFIDVPTAGERYFGWGRAQSYAAANAGRLPTVRVGRRVLVPVTALERLVAELAEEAAATAAANWRGAPAASRD